MWVSGTVSGIFFKISIPGPTSPPISGKVTEISAELIHFIHQNDWIRDLPGERSKQKHDENVGCWFKGCGWWDPSTPWENKHVESKKYGGLKRWCSFSIAWIFRFYVNFQGCKQYKTGWWLNQPICKKFLVKLGSSSAFLRLTASNRSFNHRPPPRKKHLKVFRAMHGIEIIPPTYICGD